MLLENNNSIRKTFVICIEKRNKNPVCKVLLQTVIAKADRKQMVLPTLCWEEIPSLFPVARRWTLGWVDTLLRVPEQRGTENANNAQVEEESKGQHPNGA